VVEFIEQELFEEEEYRETDGTTKEEVWQYKS
jgi:hypothetical protein